MQEKREELSKVYEQEESQKEVQKEAPPQEEKEEDIEAKLRVKEAEAKEYYDKMLRLAAELENYKKQVEREKETFSKYALESLVKELLPFIDNLERALEHARKEADIKSLVEGLELTLKGFLKTLEKFGLQQLETTAGEPFNPEYHEALMVEESEEHEHGAVIRELQKGYKLHERVVRPALVVVSKRPDNKRK